MKEWFKARNVWGAAIRSLPDESAGRLAKAIWTYTMDGSVELPEGDLKAVFTMILMTLDQDDERETDISEKRSAAGSIGGQHTQANRSKTKQVVANQANATNKNQNKNQNQKKEKESESESESFMADDDAHRIQQEQDKVLDAADDAGFKMSNNVRASLIRLYADHGQKVIDALGECSRHGAPNLAYLEAVLKGDGKKRKEQKDQYEQRDYGGEDDEAVARMMDRMRREAW